MHLRLHFSVQDQWSNQFFSRPSIPARRQTGQICAAKDLPTQFSEANIRAASPSTSLGELKVAISGVPTTKQSTCWALVLPACAGNTDRKSTRLNSSHLVISYAVFC